MLDIRVGAPQAHESITIFPLLARGAPELPYALLADAIAAGTLRIGEVGQGTVPTLKAHNAGDADVLVLDGEQLIGSRQNRMTNRTILLAAHSTVEIPVSCMEQGRWHFVSPDMQPAPQHSPAKVRRHAREIEAQYARSGEVASEKVLYEAQGRVWDAIADTVAKLEVHSPTGAMDAVYVGYTGRLDTLARAFPAVPEQVGLLAFAGGVPIGLDVVGGRTLYARLHPRLLRGYLLDALDGAAGRARPIAGIDDRSLTPPYAGGPLDALRALDPAAAQVYLDVVREARRVAEPTVGKGSYAVLAGAVIGGELLDGDAVAHLSAFPADELPAGGRGPVEAEQAPLARPSERRRFGFGRGRE